MVTKEQAEIASATDKMLLTWLTKGKEQILEDGTKILRECNAAEMKAILTRLAQLGIGGAAAGTGSASDGLVQAARRKFGVKFQGRTVPALDLEEDDAATGTGG